MIDSAPNRFDLGLPVDPMVERAAGKERDGGQSEDS